MSQCGLCVGPCECPRPTGCNLCAPICECGAEEAQACRTLQDREAPEVLRPPVMEVAGHYMGIRVLTCPHTTGRAPMVRDPDWCEAGICRVPPEPPTAPYAEGDLDALLAAFHGEGK